MRLTALETYLYRKCRRLVISSHPCLAEITENDREGESTHFRAFVMLGGRTGIQLCVFECETSQRVGAQVSARILPNDSLKACSLVMSTNYERLFQSTHCGSMSYCSFNVKIGTVPLNIVSKSLLAPNVSPRT